MTDIATWRPEAAAERLVRSYDKEQPSIFRRVEKIVFRRDKAVCHELSFSVDRTIGEPGPEFVPLLYLPKRTLFQLDLGCDGAPLVIPSKKDSAERTGATLRAVVERELPRLLDGRGRTFAEAVVELVTIRYADDLLSTFEAAVGTDVVEAIQAGRPEVWRIIELLATHRLLFVQLPHPTLAAQVVKFGYTEYLDVTSARTWWQRPMASYFATRHPFDAMRGPRRPLFRQLASTSTTWRARAGRWTILHFFPIEVMPVTLLPLAEPQSFRLELEAPTGIDIGGVEVVAGDRTNPLLPADPHVPLAARFEPSNERIPEPGLELSGFDWVEQSLARYGAPDRSEEDNGFLAHVHLGNRKIRLHSPPVPATALIELRTSREGPVSALRHMAWANFALALFAALAMRKLLSTETDAAVALLLVASASISVILSREPGEHGVASGLLSPIRRTTFWSGVTVYAVAAAVVLAGHVVSDPDDIYASPARAAEWFARAAAGANLARAVAVYVRYKLSMARPFIVGRRRRHYLRNALWGAGVGVVALALIYAAFLGTTVRAVDGPVRVHVEPRGHRARGERPPEADLPVGRVTFEPGHKLTLGITLRNPGMVGVTVAGVAVPDGWLAADSVEYMAQVSGPPGPEPLTPFRPFPLPRHSADRYVEVDLLWPDCAPDVESVTIDAVRIAVRRWEIPRYGGERVELLTPIVVDVPESTWCSAGTAAPAKHQSGSYASATT